MPSTRISESARDVIRKLSKKNGESMQAVLERAIELYRRQRFLEESNAAFAALRANPSDWREEQNERKAWDITLISGLEEN